MGYLNPLLALPAGRALRALPAADRKRIEAIMRELREQADDQAVATYARHLAHALSYAPPADDFVSRPPPDPSRIPP